jgi:dipeptidyl aminopeptidase/acylaminoacyl peptidase
MKRLLLATLALLTGAAAAAGWPQAAGQIVFGLNRFCLAPGPNGGYVVGLRTHRVRRLTNLPYGATEPQWSPDGRWIAFVGAVAPDRIYLLSTKTHKAHAVGRATGLGIAWSPDSKQLVFNTRGPSSSS